MANSLPSPLNVRASNSGINLKSSAARSPRPAVTEGNIGTYSHQQFISGDGIDMQALKTFIAHYYGNGIDWRPAVNTADGREGFLFRSSTPIGPEIVQLLQQETEKLREAEKQLSHSKYFDKLHAGWAQHQQYLAHEAQIRDINSIPTHRIDRNLPVPFLDLPPQYDDIEGLDSNRKGIQPAPITSGSPMTLGLSSRRRPVSCSDLKFFSPSGGFYPDGYSDSEAEGGEDASGSGLTFSRVYGPPGLPEIMPIYASNVDRGFCSPTAPQNTNSLRQGYSGGAGSMRNRSTHTTLLSKARSTTSLRSSHYGFAYRPSPRLNVPSSELFIGTLGTSLRGNNQQLGPLGPGQNYADGRPAWV